MTLLVVVASALTLTAGWCRVVLTNEEFYLRAVGPLGGSERFARLAGWWVALSLRRRARNVRFLRPSHTRTVGSLVHWSMTTLPFSVAWPHAQRSLHRRWVRGALPVSPLRVGLVMVFLATAGSTSRAARRLTRVRRRTSGREPGFLRAARRS